MYKFVFRIIHCMQGGQAIEQTEDDDNEINNQDDTNSDSVILSS